MNIKADITYLSDGELDKAENIIIDDTIQFDTLMDLYELLTPENKELFSVIDCELQDRARLQWAEDRQERADEKRREMRR